MALTGGRGPGALQDLNRPPDLLTVPAPAARSVRGGPHQGPPHTSGALTSSPGHPAPAQLVKPWTDWGAAISPFRQHLFFERGEPSTSSRNMQGRAGFGGGSRQGVPPVDERGDAMTERETLTRIILDMRASMETAQAAVCDLLDEIAVDLTALESLSDLLSHSNICSNKKPESVAAQRVDEIGTK